MPPWERYLPHGLDARRVETCIGLISDTHLPERCTALPAPILDILSGAALLLHAGDVGELHVLDQLGALAPVIAVHGNDETAEAQRELPYQQLVAVGGQRLLLTHAHYPDRAEELASRRDDTWEPKLERRAAMGRRAGASIVIFGHLHVPLTRRCGSTFLVCPGAIAAPNATSRQRVQSVALLFLRDDGPPYVSHVDLASPAQPFEPRIDWAAGFQAAHRQFSASLLTPELAAVWDRWRETARLAPEPCGTALLRVARRCWSGAQPAITGSDLLAELRADPTLPATVLAQFAAVVGDIS